MCACDVGKIIVVYKVITADVCDFVILVAEHILASKNYTGVKDHLGSKVSAMPSPKTLRFASLRARSTVQTERRGNGSFDAFPELLTQGYPSPLYV